MHRLMVYLEERQYAYLKRRADRTGRSMAELIRQAVDEYMARDDGGRPDLSFVGSAEGPRDGGASERDEELLRELFR